MVTIVYDHKAPTLQFIKEVILTYPLLSQRQKLDLIVPRHIDEAWKLAQFFATTSHNVSVVEESVSSGAGHSRRSSQASTTPSSYDSQQGFGAGLEAGGTEHARGEGSQRATLIMGRNKSPEIVIPIDTQSEEASFDDLDDSMQAIETWLRNYGIQNPFEQGFVFPKGGQIDLVQDLEISYERLAELDIVSRSWDFEATMYTPDELLAIQFLLFKRLLSDPNVPAELVPHDSDLLWTLAVCRALYKPMIPYHSYWHSTDVAQYMSQLLSNGTQLGESAPSAASSRTPSPSSSTTTSPTKRHGCRRVNCTTSLISSLSTALAQQSDLNGQNIQPTSQPRSERYATESTSDDITRHFSPYSGLDAGQKVALTIAAVGHDILHPGLSTKFVATLDPTFRAKFGTLESFHGVVIKCVLRQLWPAVVDGWEYILDAAIGATELAKHRHYIDARVTSHVAPRPSTVPPMPAAPVFTVPGSSVTEPAQPEMPVLAETSYAMRVPSLSSSPTGDSDSDNSPRPSSFAASSYRLSPAPMSVSSSSSVESSISMVSPALSNSDHTHSDHTHSNHANHADADADAGSEHPSKLRRLSREDFAAKTPLERLPLHEVNSAVRPISETPPPISAPAVTPEMMSASLLPVAHAIKISDFASCARGKSHIFYTSSVLIFAEHLTETELVRRLIPSAQCTTPDCIPPNAGSKALAFAGMQVFFLGQLVCPYFEWIADRAPSFTRQSNSVKAMFQVLEDSQHSQKLPSEINEILLLNLKLFGITV